MQSYRNLRLLRTIRTPSTVVRQRSFHAPTKPLQADLVQDLYLRELKNYKPAPVKSSDADAHVRKFAVPTAPPPPEEGDMAQDLKSYEGISVDVEGGLAPGEEPVDKFKQFLEDELKFYEQDPESEH